MLKPLRGLLFGIILTAVFLWPILGKLNTHLYSRQDGILVAWLIDWGSKAFTSGQNFFNAPFFYPYQNTIAYSDLFLSTALFNIPLLLIGSTNIIFNNNLHLITGSVVIFFCQYLLGKEIFKKESLAVLSGVIFSFSHIHLDYMAHLHVFLMAGLPLAIFFLLRFEKTEKNKYLVGLSLACLYQFLNSPMSGYFVAISLAIIFIFNKNIRNKLLINWKSILPLLIGSFLLLGFFYLPYFQVKNEFQFTRTIRDAAHFAFGLEKLLEPEMLFFGALFAVLGIGLQEKIDKKWLIISSIISLVGLTFMLGPALKIHDQTIKIAGFPIPLPYGIAYYLIPGFQAFRASSRFIVLLGFGLSLLIPYFLQHNLYLNKLKNNQQNKLNWLIVFIIIFVLWFLRLPRQKIFMIEINVPPIYEVIKQRPEPVLAEFPTYVWSQTDKYFHEADRLLYQSYHQKKLYNGFSGFAPPESENLWHTISNRLDSLETITHLKNSKVELVLLHQNEQSEYQNFSSANYQLITCLEQDCLYQLK
ncbi:hypothetical protein KJZ63_00710 [Patescibacteria group bacterium]|nr:hypothetical protein [Patescibacteria group bacterium]